MANLATSILAVDIGGGTQDILLYDSSKTIENCFKLVLPSPTVVVSKQIEEVTRQQKALYLAGNLMGGGAVSGAIKRHLAAGLKVYALPQAAKTLKDNLQVVQEMGIILAEQAPEEAQTVQLGDVQIPQLAKALQEFGVAIPSTIAIAVQDHGECPGMSNRKFRFEMWREFLEQGGNLADLLYTTVPNHLTRMQAVQQALPGAYLMDTGSAAVWGALCDPKVQQHLAEGLVVVNVGNQHTLAFLIQGERIWGVFEHHTKRLTSEAIDTYVKRLIQGELTNAEVFADAGHGCWVHPEIPDGGKGFEFIAVTGPNRQLVSNCNWYQAVPYGDMMLSGSFGLVAAVLGKFQL